MTLVSRIAPPERMPCVPQHFAFLLLCAAAAVVPLLPGTQRNEKVSVEAPAWPEHFNNQPLEEVPLSQRDRAFSRGFPGRIKTFRCGDATLIMRWVTQPTRKLHPSADCFRGDGWRTRPGPLFVMADGTRWGRFAASRDGHTVEVIERISSAGGQSWTDASAWFWEAALGRSPGPWMAVTIIRETPNENH